MLTVNFDHLVLFVYLVVGISLTILILLLSSVFSPYNRGLDAEKLSAYECGFNPFEQSREPFNVHFYVVGIMFIIFDVELIFLFPWVIVIGELPFFATFAMYSFLVILALGFVYEIRKGVLNFTDSNVGKNESPTSIK